MATKGSWWSTRRGVTDTFSRKTRKELDDLREDYDELEDKYENLQSEHGRLQEEAGEQTNIRISYIEEEIETMNQRVEKLAADSYTIRGEVREIHESVVEMQAALSDIVGLYKAILSRYGFGQAPSNPMEPPVREATSGEDPGDAIIRALRERQERRDREAAARRKPQSQTVPPRPGPKPRSDGPPPSPPTGTTREPSTTNALDELHRVSKVHEEVDDGSEGEDLAARIAGRSNKGSRVDRIARRDMDRMNALDRDVEGEFTKSLPKKSVEPKARPALNGEWEATAPPPAEARSRKKPRLDDLLDPH